MRERERDKRERERESGRGDSPSTFGAIQLGCTFLALIRTQIGKMRLGCSSGRWGQNNSGVAAAAVKSTNVHNTSSLPHAHDGRWYGV